MAKGKLFIIEAGDGSGKETQTRMLAERLVREGRRVVPVVHACAHVSARRFRYTCG